AAADYDDQQTVAKAEYRLRRERGNAEADAEARQKAVNAEPSCGLRSQSRMAKRRQSTLANPVGSNKKKSRAKKCGKQKCGWVTAVTGRQCKRSPAGVVHLQDEKLCTACHRSV
ncbi:unnamed protein product, partial [Ectocarpus sp. 4 AP-2014]